MGRKNKAKIKKAHVQALAAAKAKKKLTKSMRTKPESSTVYSVDDLMQKADECMDSFQLELACKFCEKALQIEPTNIHVLDTLGPLLLEIGDTDKAIDCFKRSVVSSPDVGYTKYLYLGQLSEGEDAVGYFKKGIEIMVHTLQFECETGDGVTGGACASVMSDGVTREELSNAYCSLAEVYLTDSCFSADAGTLCHEACLKSLEFAPNNSEAYQIQASCLLSLEKTEEAKKALVKSVSLWLPMSPTEGDDATMMSAIDLPPYGSRLNSAKLLMELEEYEMAFRVLESLLRDDDEVVAVWYLMGWLHCLTKDADSARFYLEQTMTLFSKHESDEVDMLEHTKELLSELGPVSEETLPEGIEHEDGSASELGDVESTCIDTETMDTS